MIFLRVYYALLFYVALDMGNDLLSLSAGWSSQLQFPVTLLVIGLCLAWPQRRSLRVLAFLTFAMLISALFSLENKVFNSCHGFVITSFLMCLYGEDAKRNRTLLRVCQAALFAPYFLSGLWKIRALLTGAAFENVLLAPLTTLAYAVAEGNGPSPAILSTEMAHVGLLSAGWLAVLLFECSSFVPVIWPRWTRVWGTAAIGFHIANGVLLGVWFNPTVLVCLFFFVIFADESSDQFLRDRQAFNGGN